LTAIINNRQTNVFQQSATFFGNLEELFMKNQYITYILLAAFSVHQTRFTFCYEVPRYRRRLTRLASKFNFISSIFRAEYVHCVGHGLFIKSSYLVLNPFPPGQSMEDVLYGFILSCLDEPVYPLEVLDLSHQPVSLASLLKQKSRWYAGLIRIIHNIKLIKNLFPDKISSRKILIPTVYCFFDIVVWALLGLWPLTIVFLSINPAFYSLNFSISLFYISFLLYMASMGCIALHVNLLTNGASNISKKLSIFDVAAIVISTPIVLIIHSLSSWYVLVNLIFTFNNNSILNSKTERN